MRNFKEANALAGLVPWLRELAGHPAAGDAV